MTSRLTAGALAPDFTLPTSDGNTVSLADFHGRRVIVYFYPAAMTPGCTTQAGDFRDSLSALHASGVAVVGISPDPVDKLATFAAQEHLTFPLASDVNRSTMTDWGAYGEKLKDGKRVTGVIRTTVVVDQQGRVETAEYDVKALGHVATLRTRLGVV